MVQGRRAHLVALVKPKQNTVWIQIPDSSENSGDLNNGLVQYLGHDHLLVCYLDHELNFVVIQTMLVW